MMPAVAAILLASALALTSCESSVVRPAVERVTVTPPAALLAPLGSTRQLTASAVDGDGNAVARPSVRWTAHDPDIATVDARGLVTARSEGTTVIRATVGAITAEADLRVIDSDDAPTLYVRGNVLTVDPVSRVEEAVVVVDDRIEATGTSAELIDWVGPAAVTVDLDGHTLMPGFVDPHNHAFNAVSLGRDPIGSTYDEVQQLHLAAGTTTIGNAYVWPGAMDDFADFVGSGQLRIRTSVYLAYNDPCGVDWPADWYLAHPPTTDPSATFRVAGIKFFADGGACNRPAATFFSDRGDLYVRTAELADALDRVRRHGYQPAIHAIGDIAIDTVLAAIDAVLAGEPNDGRIRVEHNRWMRTRQRSVYGDVGALPVVFGSPWLCSMRDGQGWSFLLDDRFETVRHRFDNWRALIDANAGLRVAWKSDATRFAPYEPLVNLWSLVTRGDMRVDGSTCENPPEWLEATAVTVDEALEMMTVNAAYALRMDDVVGSVTPGKLADLVVLSDDPRTVDPSGLKDIEVRMTMVDGQVEYCAPGFEALCSP